MLERLVEWLENSALHAVFLSYGWFVPAVQTVHILGIAAVVTTISLLSVSLMRGPAVASGLAEMTQRFIPWAWIALVVLLVTGVMLIITEPAREILNKAFWIKMGLVMLLTALTVLMHFAVRNEANFWSASRARRGAAVMLGMTSLLLCVSIVAAGRLIAYVQDY